MPSDRIRVLITADPEIPVPPVFYGGIERIVHMLICGLNAKGHQVHLFAHPQSKTPAQLIPYLGRKSRSLQDTLTNALQIKDYIKKVGGVDIVHSFSRLAYLLFLLKGKIPKVQSYQRHITPRSIYLARILAGNTIHITACSRYCANTAHLPAGRWSLIPNGVPLDKYKFNAAVAVDAPLIFLGRIERIKGVHTAIEVSKRTGRKLIIAGNYDSSGHNHRYYIKEVLPHCDGRLIQYIGAVDDFRKSELLGSSAALLFPVEWEEPFGIVMVEALACGTPVIAFDRGAVSEIITHGVNGYVCKDTNDMSAAVDKIGSLDRVNCRRTAEERFSAEVITAEYLKLYMSRISSGR